MLFVRRVLGALLRIGYELKPYRSSREAFATLLSPDTQRAILAEMKKIPRPDVGGCSLEPPARFLIYRASLVLGEEEVRIALGDSWAAKIYRSMREHYCAIEDRKLRNLREQQQAKERCEENRRIASELRAQRKKAIDERWRRNVAAGTKNSDLEK